MKPVVSPRELATAIGVSESSLKRWADDGLIAVSKTAGGHRRIQIGDAIRFIRAIRAPLVRPDVLGLGDAATFNAEIVSAEPAEERLLGHMLNGRARHTRAMLLSAYLSGATIAELADGPIRHAMHRLGELWRHDPAGVFIEHRATDICMNAVHHLRLLVEPADAAPAAVGGAAAGDPYALPTLLVATALAAEGWQAVNLGPDTPETALLQAVAAHDARLAWLSVSTIADEQSTVGQIGRLAAGLQARGTPLFVGGQALGATIELQRSDVRICASIADLVRAATEVRAVAGRPVSTTSP